MEERKQINVIDIEDSIMNRKHEENMFNKVLDKQRFVVLFLISFPHAS